MSEQAIVNTQYTLWSSAKGAVFPVVNGYSGQRTKIQKEIADISADFPDAKSLDYFSRICGLRTVFVIPSMSATWNATKFEEALAEWQGSFSKVTRASDGSLAIELAEREQVVTSAKPITFFAPRSSVARLTLSLATSEETSEKCGVTVESLGKLADGEVAPLQSTSYLIVGQQEVRIPPPPELSKASPHVLRVSSVQGCQVRVGCDS
jgi:hypothetical protein